MFQYKNSAVLSPGSYIYYYNKDNIQIECLLKIITVNVLTANMLRVSFNMTKVFDERNPHEHCITENDISEAMYVIDDFMYLLQEHLVIDEHYSKIVVFPYGNLNKTVKTRYNLEYCYQYE